MGEQHSAGCPNLNTLQSITEGNCRVSLCISMALEEIFTRIVVETSYRVWFHSAMVKRIPSNRIDAPNDEVLVAETLAGDRKAYQTIVEKYQDRLYAVAFDILKSREDAQDVVQESFVKAFFSLNKFKGESSLFSWLYRITFNMALDLKRKYKRRGGYHVEYTEQKNVSPESEEVNSTSPPLSAKGLAVCGGNIEGPFEALVRKQTGAKLDEVFSELSEEHRAVITLREVDGLDYDEIATRLEIPRGTVMSRLFYARKALQKALNEIAPEGSQRAM